jgi:hypothetical protein
MSSDAAQPSATPASRQPKNRKLAFRTTATARPPGYLPSEVACQSPLAQHAFALLCAKPGRSLASIARELGACTSSIAAMARAGRWHLHLASFLQQSTEQIAQAAQQEAQRSRAELLASNRLAQGAVDAALADLIEVDEAGNVRLKPGRTVADVQRLQQARQTHAKTTAMITGQEAAERRQTAVAGATKVIMKIGALVPEALEREVKGTVVASDVVSPRKQS